MFVMMRPRGTLPAGPGSQGASYFEFVLAVIIITILIGVALMMLLSVSAKAEQARMSSVIQTIEQALFTLNSEYKVKNRMWKLQDFEGSNPMQFLLKPFPGDYRGERGNLDGQPDRGSWYFNYDRDVLTYRVRNQEALVTDTGSDQIDFKLRFKYADKNDNRRFDEAEDVAYGLVIETTTPYVWVD